MQPSHFCSNLRIADSSYRLISKSLFKVSCRSHVNLNYSSIERSPSLSRNSGTRSRTPKESAKDPLLLRPSLFCHQITLACWVCLQLLIMLIKLQPAVSAKYNHKLSPAKSQSNLHPCNSTEVRISWVRMRPEVCPVCVVSNAEK